MLLRNLSPIPTFPNFQEYNSSVYSLIFPNLCMIYSNLTFCFCYWFFFLISPLFFLPRLARDLTTLFTFSNIQLLALWIFCVYIFCFIDFVIIFFLQFRLGSIGYNFWEWYWDFSAFHFLLIYAFRPKHFPLTTVLLASSKILCHIFIFI